MEFENDAPELRSAHVIVVGNEKGGAGKSTISIYLTVALLKAGHKVACIDLDTRQQTMTRFFENRRSWSAQALWRLEMPEHCAMTRGDFQDVRANEAHEFAMFADAIGAVEHDFEFVVIDTPASDSYLMRLAHSLADTLVSPLNDSYVDIDVFSRVQHDRSQRGAMLAICRTRRRSASQAAPRRQRPYRLGDRAQPHGFDREPQCASQIAVSVGRLAQELRFRIAEGLHDRVIFRELFPIGLTALDRIEDGGDQRRPNLVSIGRAAGDRKPARRAQAADAAARPGASAIAPQLAPARGGLLPATGRGVRRMANRTTEPEYEDCALLHARPRIFPAGGVYAPRPSSRRATPTLSTFSSSARSATSRRVSTGSIPRCVRKYRSRQLTLLAWTRGCKERDGSRARCSGDCFSTA